ncbi:TIGR03982 family His-Xaa-Ser system protein [Marinobacter halodurans]|nr:TIGR03982 family His-Xaa-Ser system protein [Marinobacter halodurans]
MTRTFQVIVALFCLGWLAKNLVVPAVAYWLYQDDYVALASQCGEAMDESWFAQQAPELVDDRSSQVQLLVCHEYDKTRKVMLSMGLSESVLAYLGLKALETGQHSAQEIVEQHRFQQR